MQAVLGRPLFLPCHSNCTALGDLLEASNRFPYNVGEAALICARPVEPPSVERMGWCHKRVPDLHLLLCCAGAQDHPQLSFQEIQALSWPDLVHMHARGQSTDAHKNKHFFKKKGLCTLIDSITITARKACPEARVPDGRCCQVEHCFNYRRQQTVA